MTRRSLQVLGPILLVLLPAGSAVFAATTLWWDTNYLSRFNVDVATGANVPDKGYNGYTARIASLDTQALVAAGEMQADCSDLRITYFDGLAWQELPRHVINCNSATTDIRFMLAADFPASSNDDNYYLYYNNSSPAALPAFTTTNVYLWFDDATIDRSAQYVHGRIDAWHGSGWDDSLVWNGAGYYTYDNGDNFTSGYRRAIDERDVYGEAEWYHTGCYPLNITTGILLRGIIASGSGGSETSDHYYATNRGEFPGAGCTSGGYNEDGDIVEDFRTTTTVDGANPPDVLPSTWRQQGLAIWLTGSTNLAYYDENDSSLWSALGYPSAANLHVSGTDGASENTGRGFGAFMTAQDTARIRNILFRRYINPEPTLTLTAETQPPALILQKTLLTVFDPISGLTNPKAIPRSHVDYTITASNSGAGEVDSESLLITDPLPSSVELFVGDLGSSGSGPVEFTDGVGPASSGLTYVFGGLADLTDDVEFSTDGIDWTYEPTPDVDGFDAAVTYIRVRPSGTFLGTATATPTQFSLRMRVRVL